MHPLFGETSELSDDQLSKKISEITRVLNRSSNMAVSRQARMILDDLLYVQQERNVKKFTEYSKDNGLDSIINIQ